MSLRPLMRASVSAVGLLAGVACDDSAPPPLAGETGETEPEPVAAVQSAEPQDYRIDDFEDGDLKFVLPDEASEGQGHWVALDDASVDTLEVSDDGADDSARALRAIWSDGDATAAGFAAQLSPEGAAELDAHNYSTCSGLELWAKLGSTSKSDSESLSIAVQSASGSAHAELELTPEWQRFSLDWADLTMVVDAVESSGSAGSGGVAGRAATGPGGVAGGSSGSGGAADDVDAGQAGTVAGASGSGGVAGAFAAGQPGAVGSASGSGGAAGQTAAGQAGGAGAGAAGASSSRDSSDRIRFDASRIQSIRFDQSKSMDVWLDQIVLKQCVLNSMVPPIPDPPELGSAGPEGSAVARHGQLRVSQGTLVDQSGDPVQLKGMSSMWLNWEPDGYAESKEALRWMRDNWNLTVIRAAMGVDPGVGGYLDNPTRALGQVEAIVHNAIDLGVYVIIDWHSHHATDATEEAREFFSQMAEAYGAAPNVIYEPFNEPLEVSWGADLKPYYEAVVTAIRAWDPDNLVILGTPRWSQLVGSAASDPLPAKNIMYALHFYACTHSDAIRRGADDVLNRGVGVFVTEWGATNADGGMDGNVCESVTTPWLEWMAERKISWTAWKLDNCTPDATCILARNAPLDGGWTDELLHGHGPLVREWMQRED